MKMTKQIVLQITFNALQQKVRKFNEFRNKMIEAHMDLIHIPINFSRSAN